MLDLSNAWSARHDELLAAIDAELGLSPSGLRMPILFAISAGDVVVHDVTALRAVRHRRIRPAVVHVVAQRHDRTCHLSVARRGNRLAVARG